MGPLLIKGYVADDDEWAHYSSSKEMPPITLNGPIVGHVKYCR